MARSTIFRYKGREVDPRAVGQRLGVRAVLTGRIRQLGDKIEVGTELIDVANDSQLWGEHYSRKPSDIFEVQEGIAREITEKLRLRLSREEKKRLAKRYTESSEAYQLYLKGRYFFNKRTEEGLKKSIRYLQQAIEKDPNYALAYAGLADCYHLASDWILLPKEAMAKAEAWTRKALEIDDTLAEAHTSLALITWCNHWDWARAERELKRAIELKPKYADAHWFYGIYLASMRRFDAGLAEMKQAQELDPLSLPINTDVGWVYYISRRYSEAIEQLREALEIDPNYPEALVYLGRTYLATKEFPQAIASLEKASGLDDAPWILAILGYARAVSGHSNQAWRTIEQLMEMSKQRHASPLDIAVIFIGLNEKEQAFSWLEKAYEERANLLGCLGVDPVFDNLRSDAQFADLLHRIGLDA